VPWNDPKRRRLQARLAANARWSKAGQRERQAQADKMTKGKVAKYLAEIDPDGNLTPDELAQQLANRLEAEMARLTLARRPKGDGSDAA
jgi:hypothetical protein